MRRERKHGRITHLTTFVMREVSGRESSCVGLVTSPTCCCCVCRGCAAGTGGEDLRGNTYRRTGQLDKPLATSSRKHGRTTANSESLLLSRCLVNAPLFDPREKRHVRESQDALRAREHKRNNTYLEISVARRIPIGESSCVAPAASLTCSPICGA